MPTAGICGAESGDLLSAAAAGRSTSEAGKSFSTSSMPSIWSKSSVMQARARMRNRNCP